MKTRRMLSLVLCVLLAAGMFPAAAERALWDCPRCGHRGNRTDFCGACQWQAPPEGTNAEWSLWTCPNCGTELNWGRFCIRCGQPRPTEAPAETGTWTALYRVFYTDEAGNLLNSETLPLSGSGTVTYWIYANDTLVPPGYVLIGEDSVMATVTDGRAEPGRITFVYRKPASPTPSPAGATVRAGEYVTFGHYEQDNVSSNGAEPIQWLVLEVDEEKGLVLLLSRYGLDTRKYNAEYAKVTWETCSLRAWLNGTFLDSAFTREERQAIEQTAVNNSASQGYWSTDGGKTTKDRVFLLSYAEACQYFGATRADSVSMRLRTSPTAYAKAQGALTEEAFKTSEGAEACWWWLRSPGGSQSVADAVYFEYGYAFCSSFVSNSSVCVRPALWVRSGALF